MHPDQRAAMVHGLVAVLLWSTVASAFKLSLRQLTPVQLLFYASLVSLLFLATLLAFRGQLLRTLKQPFPVLVRQGLPGLLNPWLYYLVLFKAYDLLPAQIAQPLNYSWSITLTLLAVPLLGEKLHWPQLAAIVISYLGVVIIAMGGESATSGSLSIPGVFLALGSTLIWSLYWLWESRSGRDPVPGLFLNFLVALPFVMATLIFGDGFLPANPAGLWGAFYVGIFEMGLTFVIWMKALQLARNTAAVTSLICFSPFLSLVLIHFLVGDIILPSSYTGLLFIVAGTILLHRDIIRRGAETPP